MACFGYELLTGGPPFAGETRKDVLSAHLTEMPAPLGAHRQHVPAALAELVMRSLEKRPDDRWQSADEMVRRLEPLAMTGGELPMLAPPHRRRMTAIALTVFAVAVVGATAALLARGSRPDAAWRSRWSRMHIERFTDFPGSEVDAAISTDGRFVTFLADRDSVFDAYVSRVGNGAS